MDAATWLARRVFAPAFERRWGLDVSDLRAELERSQYASAEEIRSRQLERLSGLLAFVAEHNPFYRERFASIGFEAGDLRSLDDLERLPLLTKDDIRSHADALVSAGHRREEMFHKRTGGSTGVPVHLYWDRGAHRFKRAVVKRHDAWAGYALGVRLAALWGDTEKEYPWRERVYKALCERTVYLDTLKMDEAHMDAFVRRLRRARPPVLIGHAHSIYYFTRHLLDRGVDDIGFESIISTAETLSPSERETVEARFGRIVFDRYGCEELSLIASECEAHDGLHVSAEGLLVEVLEGDADTPGRVVVTDLVNRGMPFVRYEVGDMATVAEGDCACGRGLPRLGRVFGRTTDILYAPDGRSISGVSILDTFVIHVPGIRQAQIVQDALDHVHFRVVRDEAFTEETERRLSQSVAEIFGPRMRYDVEYVEAIAPTARGKFQFTICEIDPPRT